MVPNDREMLLNNRVQAIFEFRLHDLIIESSSVSIGNQKHISVVFFE